MKIYVILGLFFTTIKSGKIINERLLEETTNTTASKTTTAKTTSTSSDSNYCNQEMMTSYGLTGYSSP